MKLGMLWYSPAQVKLTLAERIQAAIRYYENKYGKSPDACYIHPSTAIVGTEVLGIKIVQDATILPNHFWIGVEAC